MPGPFVVGQRLTADLLNSVAYRPYCRLRQTVAQTGNASTALVPISFTAEEHDPEGWHDNATNNTRVTPNIAGDYRVSVQATVAANINVTHIYAQISLNGTLYVRTGNLKPTATGTNLSLGGGGVSDIITMNGTTDYVEMALSVITSTGTWDTNVTGTGREILTVEYLGSYN